MLTTRKESKNYFKKKYSFEDSGKSLIMTEIKIYSENIYAFEYYIKIDLSNTYCRYGKKVCALSHLMVPDLQLHEES